MSTQGASADGWRGVVTRSVNLGDHKALAIDAGRAGLVTASVRREDALPPGTPVTLAVRRFLLYQHGRLCGGLA